MALGGLEPDLTLLCLLPPGAGARPAGRGPPTGWTARNAAFHQRVYEGYQAMAASGDLRFRVIDAAASPEAMLEQALQHLRRLEHGLLKYL